MSNDIKTKLCDLTYHYLKDLETLLQEVNNFWDYDDVMYRYYNKSSKTYYAQKITAKIVNMLRIINPYQQECKVDRNFLDIIDKGTIKTFDVNKDDDWKSNSQYMLEAMFHAKYMLELAVKYGRKYKRYAIAPNDECFDPLLRLYGMI
jgi:hypothetical protein